jgi:hypothetical protein
MILKIKYSKLCFVCHVGNKFAQAIEYQPLLSSGREIVAGLAQYTTVAVISSVTGKWSC